jgi:hypothetical protein
MYNIAPGGSDEKAVEVIYDRINNLLNQTT